LDFGFWILDWKRSASWAGAIHCGNANIEIFDFGLQRALRGVRAGGLVFHLKFKIQNFPQGVSLRLCGKSAFQLFLHLHFSFSAFASSSFQLFSVSAFQLFLTAPC